MRTLITTLAATFMLPAAFAQQLPPTQTHSISVEEEYYTLTPEEQHQQQLVDETHVVDFGNRANTDSTAHRSLINQFYEDQFRHSQDPRAPYFLLMSRDKNLAMGIGGDLKVIGSYDWDGSQNGPGFNPFKIPMPLDPAHRDQIDIDPTFTSIFFTVFGNNRRFGKFQIYIMGRFDGLGNNMNLHNAYATVGHWTLGYTPSTFSDPIATPPTVETTGPNSRAYDCRVLVRFMHPITDKLSYALSVENPINKIPETEFYKGTSNYLPDFSGFLQYAYNRQHVRLSGIVKSMEYRDLVAGKNHYVTGWGMNLGAKLQPAYGFNVFAAVQGGKGIGSFIQDLKNGENDLLGLSYNNGEMYAPWSMGFYAALQYHFNPNLFANIIYSQERLYHKTGSVFSGDDYRRGTYATANLFWNIAPRLQLGAEVLYGRRVNVDGAGRNGYRASILADFSF